MLTVATTAAAIACGGSDGSTLQGTAGPDDDCARAGDCPDAGSSTNATGGVPGLGGTGGRSAGGSVSSGGFSSGGVAGSATGGSFSDDAGMLQVTDSGACDPFAVPPMDGCGGDGGTAGLVDGGAGSPAAGGAGGGGGSGGGLANCPATQPATGDFCLSVNFACQYGTTQCGCLLLLMLPVWYCE